MTPDIVAATATATATPAAQASDTVVEAVCFCSLGSFYQKCYAISMYNATLYDVTIGATAAVGCATGRR